VSTIQKNRENLVTFVHKERSFVPEEDLSGKDEKDRERPEKTGKDRKDGKEVNLKFVM
jgi:hypothetical protein